MAQRSTGIRRTVRVHLVVVVADAAQSVVVFVVFVVVVVVVVVVSVMLVVVMKMMMMVMVVSMLRLMLMFHAVVRHPRLLRSCRLLQPSETNVTNSGIILLRQK